jgi:hypothetical protein
MRDDKPLIFISYSHKDRRWLDFVQGHLEVAVTNDHFKTWDDRRIEGGADWAKEIDTALEKCAAFVLLISRHSLVSSFILKQEVHAALEAHWARGVKIYPIIVRACDIYAVPWLAKMNVRPLDAKALALYPPAKRDEIMASLAAEIRDIIKNRSNKAIKEGGETAIVVDAQAGKRTSCAIQIRETQNPVPRCVELLAGSNQASTYERFDVLPEVRCGTEIFPIDDFFFSIGVAQLELKLKLVDCEIAYGTRLGDVPHPHIRAQGGNNWVISGPLENDLLARRVLGDETLCSINSKAAGTFNVAMELGCLQFFVKHSAVHKEGRKLNINKERILGVFINRCIGIKDGFVTLCSAKFDVVEAGSEIHG